jgi:hypothetical protein
MACLIRRAGHDHRGEKLTSASDQGHADREEDLQLNTNQFQHHRNTLVDELRGVFERPTPGGYFGAPKSTLHLRR